MRKIKINSIQDNYNYYLLESTEVKNDELGNLVASFTEEGEILKIIKEEGVHASANRHLVLKKDKNGKYIGILDFDNDKDFTYL
ncbi:hypothetical protein [Elizabethkingia meningoseptica]|uniref:hypothetical protein n=1 Tax=Elizabethkingia meningoseptica TaxID=238 RepID=UPI000936035A|nr:hypothetical protein [Elizabethkingia meningoseptica]